MGKIKNEVVTMDDLANDVHYLMEALRKDKRFFDSKHGKAVRWYMSRKR